tara:strand:- start:17169 stop:18230 length:1062 start_codon:yes stop_codon:yes gene_type:complete
MKNIKKYFYKKKVLITGHTGFKGTWLTFLLANNGAKILGLSKDIPTKPSLFEILKLDKKISHKFLDIRNFKKLKKAFLNFDPDFVFHLAAQAIVHKSYINPLETWTSNLNGTLNLLECLKYQKKKSISVLITSDKTYKNIETTKGYLESDKLGGADPYGASKSAADIAINSYISSFFNSKKNNKIISIARAGNVIGGGDWSEDRLIPDCFKNWLKKKTVTIRSPNSTRPWQNVIDVILGYTALAMKAKKNNNLHGEAFNFGPKSQKNYKVIDILKIIKSQWPQAKWKVKKNKKFFENSLLNLNSKKAKKLLNWETKMNFNNNIKMTIKWYQEYGKKNDMNEFTLSQIKKIINY